MRSNLASKVEGGETTRLLPFAKTEKSISGLAKAMRLIQVRQCACSVGSPFKNFLRAGVL